MPKKLPSFAGPSTFRVAETGQKPIIKALIFLHQKVAFEKMNLLMYVDR